MAVETEERTLLTFFMPKSVQCTDLHFSTYGYLSAPYSHEYTSGYYQFKFIRPGQYIEC